MSRSGSLAARRAYWTTAMFVTALLVAGAGYAASQDVYIWTDTDGQERWSNRPPAMNEVDPDAAVRIVTPRFRNRSFRAPRRVSAGGTPLAETDAEAVEDEELLDHNGAQDMLGADVSSEGADAVNATEALPEATDDTAEGVVDAEADEEPDERPEAEAAGEVEAEADEEPAPWWEL